MTEEQDFIDALDADPENHVLRGIYADWLQERDDPRADGMRALSVLKRCLKDNERDDDPTWFNISLYSDRWCHDSDMVPSDWLQLMDGYKNKDGNGDKVWWKDWGDKKVAYDAAALAFRRLPPERQQELLTVPVLA